MDRPSARWQNPSANRSLINIKHKMLFRAKQRVRTQIVGWVQYVSNQTLLGFNETRPFRVLTNHTLSGFWIITTTKITDPNPPNPCSNKTAKISSDTHKNKSHRRQPMNETQSARTKTNPALRTCHQNRKHPGADIPQPLQEPTSPTHCDPC